MNQSVRYWKNLIQNGKFSTTCAMALVSSKITWLTAFYLPKSSKEARCSLMDKLISTVFDNNSDQSISSSILRDLGHCMAYIVVNDFTSRIFPSSSQDTESLEESIASPLFVLCRSAFSAKQTNMTTKPMSLLISMSNFLRAVSFLVLYFLRGKFWS